MNARARNVTVRPFTAVDGTRSVWMNGALRSIFAFPPATVEVRARDLHEHVALLLLPLPRQPRPERPAALHAPRGQLEADARAGDRGGHAARLRRRPAAVGFVAGGAVHREHADRRVVLGLPDDPAGAARSRRDLRVHEGLALGDRRGRAERGAARRRTRRSAGASAARSVRHTTCRRPPESCPDEASSSPLSISRVGLDRLRRAERVLRRVEPAHERRGRRAAAAARSSARRRSGRAVRRGSRMPGSGVGSDLVDGPAALVHERRRRRSPAR